ncbi:MAG: glycosyltransferase family 87 protein [Flavobacteriales bacterium]
MLRRLRPFIFFAIILVAAALALEIINGRFWLNDFRVYYMAADNMRHGMPIYNEVFGEDTGLYKYVPAVLYFFEPYTFLPYDVAGILHYTMMGVMLIASFVVVERTLLKIAGEIPRPSLRAGLGLLCIAVLLTRELHLGNINLGLIFLAVLGTERFIAGKAVPAGIAFGISWLIKPYLLLMIVPLIIRREWKILSTAAATMAIGLLLPMLFEGPRIWWELLREWVFAMIHHTQVMDSPDRIGIILGELVGKLPSSLFDVALIGLAGVGLAWLTWRDRENNTELPSLDMDRAFELWLAAAVVPNLVITDQQHFMFSLPLVLFILAWLFTKRDRTVFLLFLVALFGYALRSSDLWGSAVENRMVGWGVL